MSWKFVFDVTVGGIKHCGDRWKAAEYAFEGGYRFMNFNGEVFFLCTHNAEVIAIETGLLSTDLF